MFTPPLLPPKSFVYTPNFKLLEISLHQPQATVTFGPEKEWERGRGERGNERV